MTEEKEIAKIRSAILHKLARKNKWQHSHTSFDNLKKSFPGHLRGVAEKVSKELIKSGLILAKKTAYGIEVSLNIKKRKEIISIIEEYFKREI